MLSDLPKTPKPRSNHPILFNGVCQVLALLSSQHAWVISLEAFASTLGRQVDRKLSETQDDFTEVISPWLYSLGQVLLLAAKNLRKCP